MSYQGCSLGPEREQLPSYYRSWKHDGKNSPPPKQKDLYASGHGSWSSHGATILQLSNFLFSTTASVGWYELLASVHQPRHTKQSSEQNVKW